MGKTRTRWDVAITVGVLRSTWGVASAIVKPIPSPIPFPQGCIKLHFRGRGQPVPGCVGLCLQGQAVPAPISKDFEMELDAALPSP
jgi:hypothetical protein